MATKCLSLVKGRRIRLTQLDGCGRPIYGEGSQAVSKGFISVALTANTSDSDEISVTNAAGEVCVFEPSETSLTGYSVEITFCEVDPDLFALATSQDPYVVNGDSIGFTVNVNPEEKNAFALELWAGAAGGDACAEEGSEGSFGYLLLPYLFGGIVGDFTVEADAVTFTITGSATRNGNHWGVGPYEDIISVAGTVGPLPVPLDPNDHLLMISTNQAPPDAHCGTRPLLDPSQEPLVSIAATVAGMVATFAPTPPDLAAAVHYEFGDGTWDYLDAAALGATSHTYPAAGTYTAKASSNGEWVSTVVTIV